MRMMKPPIFRALLLVALMPLLSGCATWFSQTPTGIRHTRMMVHSDQTYFGGPLEQPRP
jgi:hypothetical protein